LQNKNKMTDLKTEFALDWKTVGMVAAERVGKQTMDCFDGKGLTKELGQSLLPAAYFSDANGSAQNEDAAGAACSKDHSPVYTIADGHGGQRAAAFSSASLPLVTAQYFTSTLKPTTTATTAAAATTAEVTVDMMKRALSEVSEEFRRLALVKNSQLSLCSWPKRYEYVAPDWGDGACVLSATVTPQRPTIHTAFAGDCMALVVAQDTTNGMVANGKYCARLLSEAHWPHVPSESDRLMAVRGDLKVNQVVVNDRLLGVLAVSRSVGDIPFRQMTSVKLAKSVATCSYDLRRSDMFLVLVTDGVSDAIHWDDVDKLWPVPQNRNLLWAHTHALQRQANAIANIVGPAKSADDASAALYHAAKTHKAGTHHTKDNITAIIVDLQPITRTITTTPPFTGKSPTFSDPLTPVTPVTSVLPPPTTTTVMQKQPSSFSCIIS
jgi:serine/threonine protein phosphatase PrpC